MASPTNTSGLKQGVVNPGTSITVAAGFTFTSGRQAVVAVSKVSVGATTISGVTIAGTAATKYGSVAIGNQSFEIWAVLGAGVSASNNNVVFTESSSDTVAVDFSVEEWAAGTFSGDQSAAKNTSTGSTATPSVASATSVTATAVVYSGYFPAASQTNNGMTGPSGWTQTFAQQNSTTSAGGIAGYHEETSSGTKTASYTRSGATNGGAVIVAFTEAGDPDVDVSIDTAGAMTVAGQTVTVTISGDIGVTIDTPGAVTWAGQDITASTAENIDVAIDTAGAMTLAGQAGVDVTISVDVTNGEMSMAGQDMAVDIDSDIGVAIDTAGAIGWAGQTVATALSGDIDVAIDTAGAMAVAGQNLTVTFDGDVLVSIDTAGAMSWAGQDIGVALSGDINVSLDAGSVLLAGQTLTAVITIAVPDVVGDSQAAGTATLEGEGFVVSISMSYSNTVPAGDIKSQSPAGGVQAAVGSTVVITVSRGVAPVALIYKNGTLFDADGRMATVFLGDAEAVPADAHFIQGLAHSSIGERYVAALPASGIVQAIGGVAVRADGAMVVALDGAAIGAIEGVGVSTAGEVVVTESNPTHFVGGLGVDDVGRLSVTSGS